MINLKNHDKNSNFITKNNRRLRLRVMVRFILFILNSPSLTRDVIRVRFILFIPNSPSLTRDVTCSRIYLDGKYMKRKYKTNYLNIKISVSIKNYLNMKLYLNIKFHMNMKISLNLQNYLTFTPLKQP